MFLYLHDKSFGCVDLLYSFQFAKVIFIISASAVEENDNKFSMYPKHFDKMGTEKNLVQFSSSISESQYDLPPKGGRPSAHDRDTELFKSCNPTQNIIHSMNSVNDPIPLKHIPPIGHRDGQPRLALPDQIVDKAKDLRFLEGAQLIPGKPSKDFSLDVEELDIPWNDLVLKERIGAGISFLT